MRAFVILITLLFASPAMAATYYVNTAGSDANSCATATSATDANAKLTIAAGASCLSAGDTLSVGAGTYVESLLNPLPSGTSSSTRTRMTCEGLRTCILKPNDGAKSGNIIFLSAARNYIEIDRFKLSHDDQTGTINSGIRTSDGLTFIGLYIHDNEVDGTGATMGNTYAAFTIANGVNNSTYSGNYVHAIDSGDGSPGAHGFYVRGYSNIIERNEVTGHDGYGIQFYSGTAADTVDDNIARYNYIHDDSSNGSVGGIYVGTDLRNIAHNNIIARVHRGFTLSGRDTKVYNNSVYSVTTGMDVAVSSSSTSCEIKNNALPSESMGTADADCTYSKNIATNGDISTSVTPTQLWVDPANNLFSLIESSAGIDTGTAVSQVGYVGAGPDIGALEAPIRSSAVVEDTDKNTYLITFALATQSTRDGTGLQGCTTANWTLRDDIVGAKTESACNVVTSSKIGIDVSDGDFTTGVIDDAYARGTLTDNVAIGDPNGTVNVNFFNAYVRIYSATEGTNNIGAAPSVALTQSRFRFHKLRGTEASPSLICTACSENVSVSTPPGAAFRLRVKFRTDDDPAGTTYKLRYSKDAGAYTDIPDTIGADYIGWYGVTSDSDIPSAGAATTELLTSDEDANVACAVVRSSSDYPVLDLGNSETECEYIIKISTSAAASTTYDFRVYKSDNTALDTYSVTPRLTVGNYVMGF